MNQLLAGQRANDEASQMSILIFRIFFSIIFILLGGEHLFRDELIQRMMPESLANKRLWSVLTGLMILAGGGSIFLGFLTRIGSWVLIAFLVPVTILVHARSIGSYPPDLPQSYNWFWDVYHQGGVVKNLTLIGGCIYFAFNGAGRFSVDRRIWGEGNGAE